MHVRNRRTTFAPLTAIRNFTKVVAAGYAEDGISVNAIHPENSLTARVARRFPDGEYRDHWTSRVPIRRLGHAVWMRLSISGVLCDQGVAQPTFQLTSLIVIALSPQFIHKLTTVRSAMRSCKDCRNWPGIPGHRHSYSVVRQAWNRLDIRARQLLPHPEYQPVHSLQSSLSLTLHMKAPSPAYATQTWLSAARRPRHPISASLEAYPVEM